MFDKYVIDRKPQQVTVNKTVNEHRAPTDESIRLYKELQQKAVDSILWEVAVSNTALSGRLRAWEDHLQGLLVVGYKIKINSVDIIGKVTLCRETERAVAIDEVHKRIANEITSLFLLKFGEEMFKQTRGQ